MHSTGMDLLILLGNYYDSVWENGNVDWCSFTFCSSLFGSFLLPRDSLVIE